eukprot:SAG31_NODE_3503_length_4189_cov_1.900978_2_plen_38_part_00
MILELRLATIVVTLPPVLTVQTVSAVLIVLFHDTVLC